MASTPRTIFFLLTFLAASPAFAASHISWYADLAAAKQQSKQDSKPLLVKISTSWCGYCVKMQRETFDDQSVVNKVEECFIALAIDGDEQQDLVKRLGIQSFPTTLIVSPQMKVLKKIVGFRSPDELSGDMKSACEDSEERPATSQRIRRSVFGTTCPVTLSVSGEAVDGDVQITTDYEGYRLAFKSEQHRQEFAKRPKKYWPVVDGVCVVSALDEDNVAFGKLAHALRYQGRHWLFASESHLERFHADPDSYVQRLRALAVAKRKK